MRATVGVPDLVVVVRSIGRWQMNATVADRFAQERVVLCGDAAHQFPPTGGLDVNTRLQGMHNAMWKLALCVKGLAAWSLLETYDTERRGPSERTTAQSLHNHQQVQKLAAAQYSGADSGLDVDAILQATRRYGNHLGVEFDTVYTSSATITDDTAGNVILGRISEVTAYNPSFPQMNESMWITQGYSGTAGTSRVEVPDLQSLFSHPSKEHGFLVTKTFFEPESVFRIARVEVLKHYVGLRLLSPTVPVAPGSDVSHASPELLRQLLGDGDVELGTMLHHPEVPVALRSAEFSKHLAVLGMTGSGKSNAIKVLLHRLSNGPLREALRVVVIDTHGEYAPVAQMISPSARIVDIRLRRSVLDEDVVRNLLRLSRRDEALIDKLAAVAHGLSPKQDLEEFLAAVELEAPNAGNLADKLTRLVAAAREADDLSLWPHDSAVITRADNGQPQRLDEAGLYILDLRNIASLEERSAKAAAVMTDVFERSKHTGGQFPSLVVLDEAQYYAPEQQTGWLARARPSFDAAFAIVSEGRKFDVGLVVSSQRPARVNKDVLSQCNTHVVFRVANVEDLSTLAGSFEAASQPLLDELPGFDTGVCVVGGTAIGMLTRVEVPLFESVAVENG